MLDHRKELHELLCSILGSRDAYFDPPENVKMNYPAIRYSFNRQATNHANNKKYFNRDAYTLTVIDKNANSQIAKNVEGLPYCKFDRYYPSSNLHHFVFTIYY